MEKVTSKYFVKMVLVSSLQYFRFNSETSLSITASEKSLVLIDNSVDQLYLVYYDDIMAPDRILAETERKSLVFHSLIMKDTFPYRCSLFANR